MKHCRKTFHIILLSAVFAAVMLLAPMQASGEVRQIEELNDKLENISEEEKAVLQQLFTLEQEIDTIEQEEERINGDIADIQSQINDLEKDIEATQADYDRQLDILKQVLVNYQRGGPASTLENLLNAENLSSFIKSLNIMKDISHNVNELLTSLKEGKLLLQEKKEQLNQDKEQLMKKEEELQVELNKKQEIQKEQEKYLASLRENKAYYEEQLYNVTLMWDSCKKLFLGISEEMSQIINEGYFTLEDLNLNFSFFSISGSLGEDVLNRILSEHTQQSETVFTFDDDRVIITVPELHLVLEGKFTITADTAVQYEVQSGTFYDMPLEPASLQELFESGPLQIDFKTITKDIIAIDFKIQKVESTKGSLSFVIIPQFGIKEIIP